jgi:hypothetical protein
MRSDHAGADCPGPRAVRIPEAAVRRPAVAGTQQAAATRTSQPNGKGQASPVIFLAEPLVGAPPGPAWRPMASRQNDR